MTMILDRVTVTGADDSTNPEALLLLSKKYPFVEWGILLSKSQEGRFRFPSVLWLQGLYKISDALNLSGHICGQWVRKICTGEDDFFIDRQALVPMFKRLQLNFHRHSHRMLDEPFAKLLKRNPVQYIFQLDDVNNWILDYAQEAGIDAVPLFDLSGGAGRLPEHWPKARPGYCGYAGGLSPHNVEQELRQIAQAAGDNRVWIDVETHVRSTDDSKFELDKVELFLQTVAPWVHDAKRAD